MASQPGLGLTGWPHGLKSERVHSSAPMSHGILRSSAHAYVVVCVAIGLYLLSFALPVARIAGDLAIGAIAAVACVLGLLSAASGHLENGQLPASLLGLIANGLMMSAILSYMVQFVGLRALPSYRFALRASGAAAGAGAGAAVALLFGSESFVPHVGYFVWVGSMLLMNFGCRGLERTLLAELRGYKGLGLGTTPEDSGGDGVPPGMG